MGKVIFSEEEPVRNLKIRMQYDYVKKLYSLTILTVCASI